MKRNTETRVMLPQFGIQLKTGRVAECIHSFLELFGLDQYVSTKLNGKIAVCKYLG